MIGYEGHLVMIGYVHQLASLDVWMCPVYRRT